MDVRNNSIPFASIKVKSVLDSTKQFALIADSNGVASANIASNKNYTIQVNAIGYKKYSKTIALENSSIVTIKLLEDPTQLNQVVVTSSKALVRQEDDKAIVDPEPLAAGSTNAMETIEKTPGIFIDSDGNIYLASNSGTIDNPIAEIRKWDGTQFTIIIGTVALPLQVHGLYNSCDVLYQGQSLFAFNNYIISNFADICKYTCTGLSPTLTNAPTWVAKGGQSFASSVTTSSGAPAYVTDTMSTITRTGDILIATTAARSVSGRYVRLRISLNLNDTASRYYAGFLV